MGICVSAVTTTEVAAQSQPINKPEVDSVQEIVQRQPKRRKNFDADDSPLPAAGCCMCCLDPNLCDLCCNCDCGDCVMCYWCLTCDCCLECDECCTQCCTQCI